MLLASNSADLDQFDAFDPNEVLSDPGVRADLFRRDLSQTRLTDFFGGVSNVDPFKEEARTPSESGESESSLQEMQRMRPAPSVLQHAAIDSHLIQEPSTGLPAWALLAAAVGAHGLAYVFLKSGPS
jgi:hypothetical protein